MKLSSLATRANLYLAWRRITTGGNHHYKRYYRELYYAYEISLDSNLKDLRARLLSRAFVPTPPQRVYVPKPSGLQRPLGLLPIEDQIVLQAFANLAAARMYNRRAPLQLRCVFSSILQKRNSLFFFRDWHATYRAFQDRVLDLYRKGYRWVADFDLAAFYDTISHELLFRTIHPQVPITEDVSYILHCLKTWGSPSKPAAIEHGLPQGPIASAFLAEVFFLPIDEALAGVRDYARYVDDIRLFGQNESEVRKAVVDLERRCRDRGLIPQVHKFGIRRATSATDAVGMLPSIAAPDASPGAELPPGKALSLLRSALTRRPMRIEDKTRARFVFFRAGKNPGLLRRALTLLPRHPEHLDALLHHLAKYGYRKSIVAALVATLDDTPYEYVVGEVLHFFASFASEPKALSTALRDKLAERAIAIAKYPSAGFGAKWGALRFLIGLDVAGYRRFSRFLSFQRSPLLQACLAPYLPATAFEQGGAVPQLLKRSAFEPGLALAAGFHSVRKGPLDVDIDPEALPSQVRNTYAKLGILSGTPPDVDPLGELLTKRFRIPSSSAWRRLLATEYVHALGLVSQADPVFDSGRSHWLVLQNSFNQTLFLALQRYLDASGGAGVVQTIDPRGQLVDFGITLDPSNAFSRTYPNIANAFRIANQRRNRLPLAHPYEKKSASRTTYLKTQERNRLVAVLGRAYREVVALIP